MNDYVQVKVSVREKDTSLNEQIFTFLPCMVCSEHLVSEENHFLQRVSVRALLTFLFFVLSCCCAVLRSAPLSALCPAVLTLGALGMSV